MLTDVPAVVASLGLPTWLFKTSTQVLVPASADLLTDVVVDLEEMDSPGTWLALVACTPRAAELIATRRADLPPHLFLLGNQLGGCFPSAALALGVVHLAQLATVTEV